MKTRYTLAVIGAAVLLTAAVTGNIRWTQLRSGDRHGTGTYGQSSDGTGAAGNCAKFDASGSITDAGTTCGGGGGTGGGLTLVEGHAAASSATLDFTTCFSSTYDEYQIEINNLVPATGAVNLLYQVSSNGGSSWISSALYYTTAHTHYNNSTSPFVTNWNTQTAGVLSDANANNVNWGASGSFKVHGVLNSSLVFLLLGDVFRFDGTNHVYMHVSSDYAGLVAINAIRFYFSSGNIASGSIRCYGLSH